MLQAARAHRRGPPNDGLDLLDEGLGVDEPSSTVTRPRNRSRRLASRLATAWIGQPARDSATPSAVPTAPAGDPGDGRLTGFRVDVRMGVVARMDEVAVTVGAWRRRVELDAGRLERRGGFAPFLGALAVLGGTSRVALGVVAGQVAERSHGDRV